MAILSDEFYYQPIRIDTINTRIYADIVAKEGDANNRGLLLTLTENGLMKDTTGIALNLKWEHTSVGNQGLDNFEAVDLSKGLYKITYPTEMLNRGKVRAFIQILDGGKNAGSRNIEITVDRGVGDDTAIASSDSFTALAQALIDVNNLESTYAPELLAVKQQLADKAQSSQIKDTINAKVSQGIATKRNPMLVITLDDGSALEYTLSKPLFDSLNVKPTMYINTSPSFTSRLTPAQLKEMYAQGWEIASHTRNHVFLAEIAAPAGFTVGATQIEIWTTPTYKYIDIFADVTTNIYISDGSGSTQSETVDVTAVSAITNVKLTLTLATPLKNSYTTPVVRYSDKFIEDQYTQPIDYLNSLNIPCSHLAYPYGAMSPAATELAAKYYASARGAFPINDGTTFSNGGIVRGTENALMQYNILCGDLSNASTSYIDTLLNQTVTEEGFAVLLGHGDVFDSWNTQFIYAVNKARELGIEIVTMGEALKWHGNLLDLGKDGFKVSRSGLMRGNGINVLSPGKIDPSPSVWGFKEGWTFVRVEASDGLVGFPETAGTYVYLRTSSGNEGNGWNPQYFYATSGKIYTRNSITYNTHSPWLEIRNRSVQQTITIPTFDVGAGGTYHYATGIDVGTNYAVVIATAMSSNFIADLIYNNVFMATKMEAGMAYLSFVNRGTVTYSVPETVMNVEVIPK